MAIGAVVALVAVTGGAALGVALAAGAVVAGVGSAVAVATYIRDTENSTASSMGTYIRNSGTASLITAMVIGSFWAAPYAAKALALQETGGLPFTMLFGKLITLETVESWMQIGTEGFAALNAFFQTNELLAFFGGTKELGEERGCAAYDETKMLVENLNVGFLFMGVGQWWKEKKLQRLLDGLEKEIESYKINTVWDNIKATQDKYPYTNIPRSFEIEVNGKKLWVHGNATEHLYEELYAKIMAGEGTAYTNPNLYTQELLNDFYSSLEQAIGSEIKYNELISVGNWEFIFAPPRQEGLLPVIKHAQSNGW